MSQDKEVEKAFRNVELLAAKTYTATGDVLIAIYFQGTFYVVLGETTGEQPLLDSRFPDVSAKGRGYLVSSYGDGTMTWPQLRKGQHLADGGRHAVGTGSQRRQGQ